MKPLRDHKAKVTMGYHYNPNKKVFLVSVDLKNVSGALAGLTAALSEAGVNTLSGFTEAKAGEERGTWGFFAEASQDMRASKLKELLDSSSFVRESEVVEGTGGLVVDTIHFPLKLNSGETMILARKEVFGDMFRRLGEMFGTGGEAIIFEEGEATGESDGRRLVEVFGKSLAQQSIPELTMLYLTLGWGQPELVRFNPSPFHATLRIYNSFECLGQKSTKPNSNFIRGHLAGLINVLFSKHVKCRETKCMALGDESCEFEISEEA